MVKYRIRTRYAYCTRGTPLSEICVFRLYIKIIIYDYYDSICVFKFLSVVITPNLLLFKLLL
jgi:hypothetical protein